MVYVDIVKQFVDAVAKELDVDALKDSEKKTISRYKSVIEILRDSGKLLNAGFTDYNPKEGEQNLLILKIYRNIVLYCIYSDIEAELAFRHNPKVKGSLSKFLTIVTVTDKKARQFRDIVLNSMGNLINSLVSNQTQRGELLADFMSLPKY